MTEKIITGFIDLNMACHPVWIIYDPGVPSVNHIIGPKVKSDGTIIPRYDYVTGQEDAAATLSEFEMSDPGDSEEALGTLMEEWGGALGDFVGYFSSGITLFSKVGAILILSRASPFWEDAINAVASSVDAFDDVQSQTPGLSGSGRSATILKHAQAATKWLSRAGYVFSAISVIGETYTTWVDTNDWKATLAKAIEGTIKIIVLAAVSVIAGKIIAGIAVAVVVAGAPAVAVTVCVVAAAALIGWGVATLWEATGLGDFLEKTIEKALGAVVRWWQAIRDFFSDAIQELNRIRKENENLGFSTYNGVCTPNN